MNESKMIPESKHAKYSSNNPVSNFLVKNFLKRINTIIRELDFNSILDVGCGEGMLMSSLSDYLIDKKKCCAIDFDEKEVTDAKKNLPFCEVQIGSIYEIPFENNSFELVTCTEVMEHLENPVTALEELYRVTIKYALISVPREPLWRVLNLARFSYIKDLGNTPGHLNHWSGKKFYEFISTKFNVIDIFHPTPWSVVIAKK
jgi:ubiquinone/menaquinone biosynthesis C-methylase UbiE